MIVRNAFKGLMAFALILVMAGPVAADEKSGTVRIDSTSVAVGIGVSWGEGQLTLNDGTIHKFDVSGLSIIDLGISSVTAVGEVYNLNNLEDFSGNYVAGQAGASVVGGESGSRMTNGKGVVITLKGMQTGVKLTLAPEGVKITLK